VTGGATGSGGAANTGGRVGATGGASGTGGTAAGGGNGTCPSANEDKFSFFLVSNAALMRAENCGPDSTGMYPGCGGDLGGLAGADAICQRVAQYVSPCQSNKVWHAFLSTTTANAIDRIGAGPWYDRNGRLMAQNLTDLMTDRPTGADPAIKNDFPNENGIPNHKPDGTTVVDNHEVLTGTGPDGKVWTQATMSTVGFPGDSASCGLDVGATGTATWSPLRATCWDWTRKTAEGCPRVGHPWCSTPSCTPAGSGSGTNWMSVWNEGGCLPGGNFNAGGLDGTRKVGSAGGYGGFYCFAVIPHP